MRAFEFWPAIKLKIHWKKKDRAREEGMKKKQSFYVKKNPELFA